MSMAKINHVTKGIEMTTQKVRFLAMKTKFRFWKISTIDDSKRSTRK